MPGNVNRGRTGHSRVIVDTMGDVLLPNREDARDHRFMEVLRALVVPLVEAEDNTCDLCQGANDEQVRKEQGREDRA